ncbi:hypothetical protein EAF04_008042 [Stromatinia cepivora]|nr:hypothetical protein EAF04_008042 [Stromatinia cepivora]
MCHHTIETCARYHDSSKLTTRVPCYEWQQGTDSVNCSYTAAVDLEEVGFQSIRSRICEDCVREIFDELQNAKVDEALEGKKEWEEKQTKVRDPTTETRKPSGIVRSPRQQDLKSIADMEPASTQDPQKKQTEGKGAIIEAGKPSDAKTTEPPNLQHITASELESGQEPELRRSPRKKQ